MYLLLQQLTAEVKKIIRVLTSLDTSYSTAEISAFKFPGNICCVFMQCWWCIILHKTIMYLFFSHRKTNCTYCIRNKLYRNTG